MTSIPSKPRFQNAFCVRWLVSKIEVQIACVEKNLTRAAYSDINRARNIHRLRVATRRAMATLDFFSDFFSDPALEQLQKSLRSIRKLAGEARDIDVFLANHSFKKSGSESKKVKRFVETRQKEVQKPIRKMANKHCRRKTLQRQAITLYRSLKKQDIPKNSKSFCKWVNKRFHQSIACVQRSTPLSMNNLKELHQFRIQCKGMRYTLELMKDFMERKRYRKSLKQLIALQEGLGEINDLSVANSRLQKWEDKASRKERKALAAQAKLERKRLKRKLDDWKSKWSRRELVKLNRRLVKAASSIHFGQR